MQKKIKDIKIFLKNNFGLLLVLASFLFLAFWNFFKQGIINFDEAYFVVVIRTFSSIAKTLIFNHSSFFSGNFLSELAANYGNIYTAARPSYILPASFLAIFISPEYASRLLSLFSGFLGVIFFYRLLKLFGIKDAALRAWLTLPMAISPLYLLYSRLGLSQIFSAACVIISLYYLIVFYQGGDKKFLKIFSFSTAILFMSHYNVMFVVAVLLFFGILALIKHAGKFKDWFLYLFYFLFLPVSWEVITRCASFFAGKRALVGPVLSYSQEYLKQVIGVSSGQSTEVFGQSLYYLKLLTLADGWLILVLFILGLVFLIYKLKRFEHQVVFFSFFVSLLAFSAGQLKYSRNFVCILPLVYLIIALSVCGFSAYFDKKTNKRATWLVGFVVLLVFASHFFVYQNYLNIHSGAKETASYIKNNYNQADALILGWSSPIWRVYLPGYRAEQLIRLEEWRPLVNDKTKLLLVDDYFTVILDDNDLDGGYSKKNVFSVQTNIFRSEPVILDFLYGTPEKMSELFSKNKSSYTSVYEVINVKK